MPSLLPLLDLLFSSDKEGIGVSPVNFISLTKFISLKKFKAFVVTGGSTWLWFSVRFNSDGQINGRRV